MCRYGQLSGMVEPVAGLFGAVAIVVSNMKLQVCNTLVSLAAGSRAIVTICTIVCSWSYGTSSSGRYNTRGSLQVCTLPSTAGDPHGSSIVAMAGSHHVLLLLVSLS